MGTRGQDCLDCCLSIFLAVSWLGAVAAWRLGSMLSCNCVCPGAPQDTVVVCVWWGGGGEGGGCYSTHVFSRIWKGRVWWACSVGCVLDSLVSMGNQTSDGGPYECLALFLLFSICRMNSRQLLQLIMARNTQISGGDPLPEWNLFPFL